MVLTWNQTMERLKRTMACLNTAGPVAVSGPLHVGIDLGTADVVLMVLDESGQTVAAFLEWSEVVRDGIVVDFAGAVDLVRKLVLKAEQRLGRDITAASTSYPPGTDRRLSTNIIESVGLDIVEVEDEPSCVARLLQLNNSAVVDIGGGTTGTAVIKNNRVIHSDDEPTGGKHITLAIAGHYGISIEEAESRKFRPERFDVLSLARPVIQRISDIVATQIKGYSVDQLILTGGTCCLPGVDNILATELNLKVLLPYQPLLLTPLAIASLALN